MTFDELMSKLKSLQRLELNHHDFGKTFIREMFLVNDDESESIAFGWVAKHKSMNGEETGFAALYSRIVGNDFENITIEITLEQLFELRGELFARCDDAEIHS